MPQLEEDIAAAQFELDGETLADIAAKVRFRIRRVRANQPGWLGSRNVTVDRRRACSRARYGRRAVR